MRSAGAWITRSVETVFGSAIRREYLRGVEPAEALTRIASLLERRREPRYRVQAFRRAAIAIRDVPESELRHLAERGRLRDLPNVGDTTAAVIIEALAGKTPAYLEKLELDVVEPGTDAGNAIRAALRGDLHVHSDWSDGGDPIRTMAEKAAQYLQRRKRKRAAMMSASGRPSVVSRMWKRTMLTMIGPRMVSPSGTKRPMRRRSPPTNWQAAMA